MWRKIGLTAWLFLPLGCGRRPPPPPGGPSAASPASADQANAAPARPRPADVQGGLIVTVVPAVGISILLDGAHVANAAPFVTEGLTAGPHVLHVRAMGYHSVTLPLDIPRRGELPIAVALRSRPPLPFDAAAAAAARPPRAEPAPASPSVAPGMDPAHQPLPSGAVPMLLTATTDPPGPVVVDGVLAAGPRVRLAYGTGTLALGALGVSYCIYPGRVLELVVPHDDAAWYKEDGQVKATSRLRLESRPLHLRRVDAQGRTQVAVLHRLE